MRSRPGRPLKPLVLTPDERETLEQWARRPKSPQALAKRARIILDCAADKSIGDVAALHGTSRQTVSKWRSRFIEHRLEGLSDAPRSGAPRTITDATVERVVTRTLETKPHNATHWSTRSMAKAMGMSQTAIARIWRAFELQPHRTETFKLSTDPHFIEKVRDVVGLYIHPPAHALVLSVDEKSQIQALDRSQPLLPMRPGQVERHTHDYKRHGTTSLFAALDVKSGRVISQLHRRHRTQEFLAFLRTIERNVSQDQEVHLILDNYCTHKTRPIKRWLLKHPRFHLHFTPTGASWLNLVERLFADLTDKQLRRGVHRSVRDLEEAIRAYIEAHNTAGKAFVWTKTADEILDRVVGVCEQISNSGH